MTIGVLKGKPQKLTLRDIGDEVVMHEA